MKKVILLGAGLVGYPMALDLAKTGEFELSVADYSDTSIAKLNAAGINGIQTDLSDTNNVSTLVSDFDIVLDAVPGFMGYQTFKTVIEAGKDIVDIAFFPEDPFQLNDLAKQKGVTAIMDMGVAPGMSNILIGYADHLLDRTTKAVIYVGGLPRVRTWPYEYKAVFSPIDVIEEYTRTARFIRNGKITEMPALTEPELLDFENVGTLEAFNSDGLRSLMFTIDAPEMIEKTLRYPGHIEKMKVLRDTGFFSYDEILVNGKKIRPIDLTTKLLFPKWKLEEGEEDLTVMQVFVEGYSGEDCLRYSYDLLDYFDKETRVHSMARTTGYAATSAVRMLAKGMFQEKGVIVPEYIGKNPDCVRFILEELKSRGIHYKESITPL
jgi:saccharopine dehydrogenase-like NADP-dependent oxidoreductase